MENAKEKELFLKSIIIDLKNVNYEKNNNSSINKEQIKVIIKDYYKIIDASINGFKILYSRLVEFKPKMLFTVSVSYEISYSFADKTIKEYENNIHDLNELINIKAEKAINMTGVASRASALISCITMQNNGNAIITPPNYIKS